MNEVLLALKLLLVKTVASATMQKMFFAAIGSSILILRRGANRKEAFIMVVAAVTVGLGLGYFLEAIVKTILPAVDIVRISPVIYVLAGILSYDTVLHMVDKSPKIVDGASLKIEDALRKKAVPPPPIL